MNVRIIRGDIYELPGVNYDGSLIIQDVTVEITEFPPSLQQKGQDIVPRGGQLKIMPAVNNAHELAPGFEYEIRCADGGEPYKFKRSNLGEAVKQHNDYTIVKIA